jgi:hypothetical protein
MCHHHHVASPYLCPDIEPAGPDGDIVPSSSPPGKTTRIADRAANQTGGSLEFPKLLAAALGLHEIAPGKLIGRGR